MSFREGTRILERPFIYRERHSLEEFYEESEVWRIVDTIYDDCKELSDRFPMRSRLQLFNEARYQSVRLFNDSIPDLDFDKRYYEEALHSLGDKFNADACFLIVFYILRTVSPDEETASIRYQNVETIFNGFAFADKYLSFGYRVDEDDDIGYMDLSYETADPHDIMQTQLSNWVSPGSDSDDDPFLPYSSAWWRRVTDNFSTDRIEEIIEYWEFVSDQYDVTKILLHAFLIQCRGNTYELRTKGPCIMATFTYHEHLYKELIRKQGEDWERMTNPSVKVDDILDYAETLCEHERTAMPTMILKLFGDRLTAEQKERVFNLNKRIDPTMHFKSLMDVHGNEQVNINQ